MTNFSYDPLRLLCIFLDGHEFPLFFPFQVSEKKLGETPKVLKCMERRGAIILRSGYRFFEN